MKYEENTKKWAQVLGAMIVGAYLSSCSGGSASGHQSSSGTSSGSGSSSSGSSSGSSSSSSSSSSSGSSSSSSSGSSSTILSYPYETVYGDICATYEATPGCTFDRSTGLRITVAQDPHYDYYLNGSDDLWWVEFDASGRGAIYDNLGSLQYYADVADFTGYVGGNYIGVGTTGLFWEDIRNGTYWLGKNGVLYSANSLEYNYGDAINDTTADDATDTNFSAVNSEGGKKIVQLAAKKLVDNYGFSKTKATAVASALNAWAVAGVERGVTTTKDIDKTFKAVFGVNYGDALSAVKDLTQGNLSGMQDVTNRSAASLGLKPHQAQKFIKNMYRKALAEYGYDVDTISW